MPSSFKLKSALGIILILILVISGCKNIQVKNAFKEVSSKQKGLSAEEILPDTTLGVISFNRLSKNQKLATDKITDNFFSLQATSYKLQALINSINQELEPFSLTYENDINPLLGENYRITVGASANFIDPTQKNLNYYLILNINPEKYTELYTKLKKTNLFVEEKYQEIPILIESEKGLSSLYFLNVKDLLVIGNGIENAKKVIELSKGNGESLLSRKNFTKVASELSQEHTSMFYLDAENLLNFFKTEAKEKTEESFWQNLKSEGGILISDNNLIKLKSANYVKDSESSSERYLYEKLPGGDMIAYTEGTNLKGYIEQGLKILSSNDPDFKTLYSFIKKSYKEISTREIEEGLFSWMTKGFAFSMQNNGNKIIPGITIAIDASDNPDLADEFIKRLDAQIDNYLTKVKDQDTDEKIANAIKKEKIKIKNGSINMISFDFNKLKLNDIGKGFSKLPLSLFSENAVLYYGISDNNWVVISTYQKFASDFGVKPLKENLIFTPYKNYITDFKNELFYLDRKNLSKYLDTYVNFYEKLGMEETSSNLRKKIEPIQKSLESIKGIIFANKKDSNLILGQGAILLEEEKKGNNEVIPE